MEFKIQEYSETAAGLAKLRGRMEGVVYDVTTVAGMDSARKDRRELVTLRTTLEAKRKEIKAPALERCRLIDEEAKRITGEILKLEEPIDQQIKVEEERKAEEKRLKEEAERQRVEKIKANIAKIAAAPLQVATLSAAEVMEFITNFEAHVVVTSEIYQEWLPMAAEAKAEALGKLREILAEKTASEEEAARLQAEREEQERRRQEEEKRLAEEREKLRIEREAFEREQAERVRVQEEEDRKRREEREAEDKRLEAERAEFRHQQEETDKKRRDEEAAAAEEERKRKEEELRAEMERQQRELEERLASPYEALKFILDVAEDTTITPLAARQRILQAAKMALAGRV